MVARRIPMSSTPTVRDATTTSVASPSDVRVQTSGDGDRLDFVGVRRRGIRLSGTPIGLAPGAPELAAGQDEEKYHSESIFIQRVLGPWTVKLREAVGELAAGDTVVDVGVGEGYCIERFLPTGHAAIGIEYRFDKARVAVERVADLRVVIGDAGMLPLPDGCADLVTCIEVLEHLVTDEPAVAELARICRGRCVVSVPWEPWFRLGNLARGKHLRRFGNNPEHVQFFTPRRLEKMMATSFRHVRIIKAFPWLIAVAST